MKTNLLMIDADISLSDYVKSYFSNEGYDVDVCHTGSSGVATIRKKEPDIVILEVLLPDADGFQLCREIREKSTVPILFLTSKTDLFDKCLGLELGADDYMTKPFEIKELSARVKAILRRTKGSLVTKESDLLEFDQLQISLNKYELLIHDQQIPIPPKEIELLYFLAAHPDQVFSRNQLLDKVWGYDYLGDSRTVDVHIKRLRSKLEGVSNQWLLKTVWGVGYKFETK